MLSFDDYLKNCALIEIGSGQVSGNTTSSAYKIFNGNSPFFALQADRTWQSFYLLLFDKITETASSETEIEAMLGTIVMQDRHWRWFDKSLILNSKDYEWFYLIAENEIQGMCILYHPKDAMLENGKIFYVDYVASAPWNRSSMMNEKKYEKVGTILLKAASDYAHQKLNLKPGFSLHSLPQSESYYTRQGMVEIPNQEKNKLKYFEMNKTTNENWRASND